MLLLLTPTSQGTSYTEETHKNHNQCRLPIGDCSDKSQCSVLLIRSAGRSRPGKVGVFCWNLSESGLVSNEVTDGSKLVLSLVLDCSQSQ